MGEEWGISQNANVLDKNVMHTSVLTHVEGE
jgi:hypothetical protein